MVCWYDMDFMGTLITISALTAPLWIAFLLLPVVTRFTKARRNDTHKQQSNGESGRFARVQKVLAIVILCAIVALVLYLGQPGV